MVGGSTGVAEQQLGELLTRHLVRRVVAHARAQRRGGIRGLAELRLRGRGRRSDSGRRHTMRLDLSGSGPYILT